MWPKSAMWDTAVRGSHVIELRVDAYQGGVLVASDLPVDPESGSLNVDGMSPVRRTVELTISDPTLVPTSASSLLSPHATELHIHRGFRFPDGTSELVPIGVYRIALASTGLYGGVRILGTDRAKLVQDDAFIVVTEESDIAPDPLPTSSAGGATYLSEIQRWITDAIPGVDIAVSSAITTDEPLPVTTWEAGTSKLDAINEMALAIDCEVYCDPEGVFVVAPLPLLSADPAWDITLGEDGVIVEATEEWDREAVYNAVTVRGETADGTPPVYWTARDMNPASPTFWGGDFGHRPKTYTSPMIRSYAQALRAAGALLRRSTAPVRGIRVSALPNPALDAGDVVEVHLPSTSDRVDVRRERHMIRSYTMPLGLGPMELDLYTPEQQV